ncbi:hypothetical protein [Lacihabitans soyangensis]|uniref:Uncharacterized protein n=1 Tax=Lacihabitans soyangensis TaxID=869394 RepID=A0AAE3H6I8_9BACT|nr:hypothetical protein [Lacihabitans soyangensis]MCP9764951.1 hypothetical protein [Lacihabitans soyangensis]
MRTNTTLITEPMVLKLGKSDTLISIGGACEALVEMDNCQNEADMEQALARVKQNYEDMVAELPQLLEYEHEDKRKIQDTFWVLNNVRKVLGGIKILKV